DAGLAAALLARALLAQGRVDDADSYAAESERLAGHNLKTAIAWRAVRAEILCAQGSYHDAVVLARESVAVAVGTDLVLDHADACLALGRVLDAAGDARGADAARRDAEALYAAKEVVTPTGRPVQPAPPMASTPAHTGSAPTSSRLSVTNRASEAFDGVWRAMETGDVDAVVGCLSDRWMYDDRRGLSGGPVEGRAAQRAGIEGILLQYCHFEVRTLAVRGELLALARSRWSDDAGNETIQLQLHELGDDGLIACEVRFDEDDFESAYRELEQRYYAGEGAAFAEGGAIGTEVVIATNRGDLDRVYGDLTAPGLQFENRSRSVFPDRSMDEYPASIEELDAMVTSKRTWHSAMCWLSPTCCVFREEREAVGLDGEQFAWAWIYVAEVRDGRIASFRQFDLADEEQAFAHAEELARTTTSRLAVTNTASETWHRVGMAMSAHDVDALMGYFPDGLLHEDRRAWSGAPLAGGAERRAALERFLAQYSHHERSMLAVRGDRLALCRTRSSDDAGNETVQLHLVESDDDGQMCYWGQFDADDFETAYRELDRRYYTGEGIAFAAGGAVPTEWMCAYNRGDFDMAFGELCTPDFRLETRSSTVFGDRSAPELRATFEELSTMVASVRMWLKTICWLSPTVNVSHFEREAVGLDGEQYSWTRLMVAEVRGERVTSMCDFDPDAEDEAFAYAEERARATVSRLAVTNRSSETWHRAMAMPVRDIDEYVESFSEQWVFDDRRGFSGDPLRGRAALRTALERILEQYSHFEARTLAVRGELLHLAWSRWSDDAGNETAYVHVYELDDDGRIGTEVRFDEDDFEGAYRELDRRYYAGEGAAFAESGTVATEFMAAYARGDFDRAFGELIAPQFRLENRSSSVLGDRSVEQLRASNEELDAMVSSARPWLSAICWLSPNWCVVRFEREAVGLDGERYSWTRLGVAEVRDGQMTSMCTFDAEAEEEAFAYAEERVRTTTSRLPLANRASEAWDRLTAAMEANDADAVVALYSDGFVYDDRRGWSGDPIEDGAAWRAGVERFLAQYSHHEGRTLAVRGVRLALGGARSSDDAGNATAHLNLIEVDDDGRIGYHGRFDGDDFEGAYRELERRYYAGEGAAFAENGAMSPEWLIAASLGDFDRLLGELCTPEFRLQSRSRSVFGDLSAAELRTSFEELSALVASSRWWLSAICWLSPTCSVSRWEREAVGVDGEEYAWTRLHVSECRGGKLASTCEFDITDEDQAFAYAEELTGARPSRLAVSNLATDLELRGSDLLGQPDFDWALSDFLHEQFRVDDRRAMPSAPCIGREAGIVGYHRLLADYPDLEVVPLAVRGQLLALVEWRCRNTSGFEATYLNVHEFDDAGQLVVQVRFDADDFEGAYRELEDRYYSDEGAPFAAGGALLTDYITALNRGDFDTVFGELTAPDFRVTSRSRSVFGDRSAGEYRASQEQLAAMVASVRTWISAVEWLSPECLVIRIEREAAGLDGEHFAWTKAYPCEVQGGQLASMCEFELEDEHQAFAYAEQLLAMPRSRLAVANRATEGEQRVHDLLGLPEFDSALFNFIHERCQFIDHRAMHGAPFVGREAALVNFRRFLADYPRLDIVPLAVRGERLALVEYRGRTSGGYEATYLNVNEVDEAGQLVLQVRFDASDFEGAYRELEHRYYSGEGAAFAAGGAMQAESVAAMNRGDLDTVFGKLATADYRVTSRSRSAFGDRSADEVRASLEELTAMVASVRMWFSAVVWVSPGCCVVRQERMAVGLDGEAYSWTRLYACAIRDVRVASMCQFELEDEVAAFAYARELAQAAGPTVG
ncbi:MAG: hypothetical protein QOD90_4771, partial [Mycobacterium sp.]|nr:hypothetical protein [Mycobacterium sp.]